MSVIAVPPDWNVTTGVVITSFAVNSNVTTLPVVASVGVALFEAMLTLLSVGAMASIRCNVDSFCTL